MNIEENQRESMKINKDLWTSAEIDENLWKPIGIYEDQRKSMKINKNL